MTGESADVPAWTVSEMLLEETGNAMQAGDFETFLCAFALPYTHATEEGVIELDNACDLHAIFESVRGHYAQAGVTRVIRMCIAAEYDGPDKINATHEAHIFVRDQRVRQPFPVLSQLERGGPLGWRIRASNYAVSQDPGHADALMPLVLPSELAKRLRDKKDD